MIFTTSTFRKGAVDFASHHKIALIEVKRNEISYARKSMLERLKSEPVVPGIMSLSEYLFGGETEVVPQTYIESEEAQMQAVVIAILQQSLDYSLILASKGYQIDKQKINDLKAEIQEEEALLQRMLKNEA